MTRKFIASTAAGLSLALGAAVFAPAVLAPAAHAQSAAKQAVDAAKAAGVVGEQGDGFLGFVSGGGDAALRAAVAEINAGRAQVYQAAAQRAGTPAQAAGEAAALELFKKLPAGAWYKPVGGGWTQK